MMSGTGDVRARVPLLLNSAQMLFRWERPLVGKRDLRIDWLRGLAMTCVIVDHSRLWSLLGWFTYERFWIVTAAEVFVVLSGVVLGTVYSEKLLRRGWRPVLRGLARRSLTLYLAFLAVTTSLLIASAAGLDVESLTGSLDALSMRPADWRDLALMRFGPWPFQIVGLYVWLVAAAAPCLFLLRRVGWRVLLGASWALYLWYRVSPHALTTAEFETAFPILAWQLLFVHGIVVGSRRQQIRGFVDRLPRAIPMAVGAAAVGFVFLALSNPWAEGPAFLHWGVVSPERFTDLYFKYFALSELGIGRILNLAVGLPVGYALLTWCWRIARPLGAVFVTLGQQSLAAFVMQVYVVLLVEQLPLFQVNDFWINTLAQIVMLASMAALLEGARRVRGLMASGGGRASVRLPRDPVFGFPTPSGLLPHPAEPGQALPEPS
jgi:hypothetical protein